MTFNSSSEDDLSAILRFRSVISQQEVGVVTVECRLDVWRLAMVMWARDLWRENCGKLASFQKSKKQLHFFTRLNALCNFHKLIGILGFLFDTFNLYHSHHAWIFYYVDYIVCNEVFLIIIKISYTRFIFTTNRNSFKELLDCSFTFLPMSCSLFFKTPHGTTPMVTSFFLNCLERPSPIPAPTCLVTPTNQQSGVLNTSKIQKAFFTWILRKKIKNHHTFFVHFLGRWGGDKTLMGWISSVLL